LFDDTLDEFCSIETITQRFDEWRTRENDSYNNAYVDLFLPRLAGCIVRWHLLQALWNPLEHEVTLINKTKWFQTITQYDMRSEIKEKNQNPLIISKTIELSVVPYVVEVNYQFYLSNFEFFTDILMTGCKSGIRSLLHKSNKSFSQTGEDFN
jgi:hypothetical protein